LVSAGIRKTVPQRGHLIALPAGKGRAAVPVAVAAHFGQVIRITGMTPLGGPALKKPKGIR